MAQQSQKGRSRLVVFTWELQAGNSTLEKALHPDWGLV